MGEVQVACHDRSTVLSRQAEHFIVADARMVFADGNDIEPLLSQYSNNANVNVFIGQQPHTEIEKALISDRWRSCAA